MIVDLFAGPGGYVNLTTNEAACIQGFPADYPVCPPMAAAVLGEVLA